MNVAGDKYKQRLSLLHELVAMGDADGRLVMEEFELIRAIGERLGVHDADIERALQNDIAFTPPKHEHERIMWLHAFCMVMVADGVVDEGEIDFMLQIGVRLGFRPNALREMIRRLQRDPEAPLSPSELIRILQVTHN